LNRVFSRGDYGEMLPVPFGQVHNHNIPANFITGIVRVKKNYLK
jgi:hypothetical protein